MKQADVDEYLRQALEPDSDTTRRVARQALSSPTLARSLSWRLVVAPAVLVLVAIVGSLWWRLGPSSSPAPAPALPSVVIVERAQRPAFEITNSGGVIAVITATGQVMAIVSGGTS